LKGRTKKVSQVCYCRGEKDGKRKGKGVEAPEFGKSILLRGVIVFAEKNVKKEFKGKAGAKENTRRWVISGFSDEKNRIRAALWGLWKPRRGEKLNRTFGERCLSCCERLTLYWKGGQAGREGIDREVRQGYREKR